MKKIITFYDDIFQLHYNRLKNRDSDPEVTPIAIISFIQSTHVLFVYLLLYFLWDLADFLPIQIIAVIIYLGVSGINFYVYIVKKRRDKVLGRNKVLSKKLGRKQMIVSSISMLLPVIIIILFREVFNR